MDELYVQILTEPLNGYITVTLETLIVLFTVKYCKNSEVSLTFVLKPLTTSGFTVKVTEFAFDVLKGEDLPKAARTCNLPLMTIVDGNTCVAGLCAVLRQLVKRTGSYQSLLGFRQGCLMACAEASVWTRFCEVDMIETVKFIVTEKLSTNTVCLPADVVRFETHMAQPLRIHNIHKKNQDFVRSRGKSIEKQKKVCQTFDANQGLEMEIEHIYSEGPIMTLADIVLLPCIHIVLQTVRSVFLQPYIPLTMQWYERMMSQIYIAESISILKNIENKIVDELYVKYILPDVPKQSLYKSDPRRYKPRNRIYTKQEDVEASLKVVQDVGLHVDWQLLPFGFEQEFDWGAIPFEAHPEGGQLPLLRRERKGQQLENLAKAVLKVARPGHTIVDFCSGSGHLGIILAYLLPRCNIILLENKEESLGRARERVLKLKLTNVTFCQCNLDYFSGEFNIGVSLHACGVATDLVIQSCINRNAVFICCPCCYGSVQNNHILTYPRSQTFQHSGMSVREYLVLGHSADQTHDENNSKTDQGKMCMGIIDTDRCLQARESGYVVFLSKLIPETCTPKNNLLVGLPNNWH